MGLEEELQEALYSGYNWILLEDTIEAGDYSVCISPSSLGEIFQEKDLYNRLQESNLGQAVKLIPYGIHTDSGLLEVRYNRKQGVAK